LPAEEEGQVAYRVGMVGTEQLSYLGEAELPRLGLPHDPDTGEATEEAIERREVGAGRLGQLVSRLGALVEEIGDAEAYGHVDDLSMGARVTSSRRYEMLAKAEGLLEEADRSWCIPIAHRRVYDLSVRPSWSHVLLLC